MRRHVLDVEVVLEHGVGHSSGIVGLLEPHCKLARVFVIKEDVNPREAELVLGRDPVAFESLRFEQVSLHLDITPEAVTIDILPESLGTDLSFLRLLGGLLLSSLDLIEGLPGLVRVSLVDGKPGLGSLGVHILVIVGFKRKPTTWGLGGISKLNVHIEQELLDVELLEVDRFFNLDLLHRSLEWRLVLRLLLLLLGRSLVAVRIESRDRRCWGLSLQHY